MVTLLKFEGLWVLTEDNSFNEKKFPAAFQADCYIFSKKMKQVRSDLQHSL